MRNVAFVLFRRLRAPLIVLILVYAISITGFVLIPGMDDQGRPWRMDFFHAFYFVSFMGTTIGFGEIPYAFSGAQRMWATISMYATVVAWLYAIGTLLAVAQSPAFRSLRTENAFVRAVRRIPEPFYIVCGYGDTGSILVRALTDAGIRSVVVDVEAERIDALQFDELRLYVPGLCADVSIPEVLHTAGLEHPQCAGIVALTNNDAINLKVAITAKLLNPGLPALARAETHDAEANIASFGTDHIINPFDTFAGRLALALHAPGMYLLYEWLTGVPNERLVDPLFPPHGRWILCGYGRFGKAVQQRLSEEGVSTTIIEAEPERTQAPPDVVHGRGTEAVTLNEADIESAVGIVAGTDDDANNLSIIMTAYELNPSLFTVARQNQRINDSIFRAADIALVMQRGSIIAHKIFALITTPLLDHFLRLAKTQGNSWANEVLSRISGVVGEAVPHKWSVTVNQDMAPAVVAHLVRGESVALGDLCKDPRCREDELALVPLLLLRGDAAQLLPESGSQLEVGDRILFCGRHGARVQMAWSTGNEDVLIYVRTGRERGSSYLWRMFASS